MNRLLSYPEITLKAVESGKHFIFKPTYDITAWECAKLVELFIFILATQKDCDWEAFVNDNGLERQVSL